MIEAHFSGQQGSFRLDAAFTAPESGVTALFGPSGCGKTTVLRCVAGLIRFDKGKLIVNGETWQSDRKFVPTHRRALGYVFQEASLFPHLSVRKNLEFGLKRARRRSHTIAFDDVVDLLGVGQLFDRPTAHLSGGERQRVAIGRALLSQPQLLLMDEPLSNLDALLRMEMRAELKGLLAESKTTTIYVTHDQVEAMSLADRIAVMHQGQIVQYDAPTTVYHQPATLFVGGFLGNPPMNFLHLKATGDGLGEVGGARFTLPDHPDAILGIRPEDLHILGSRSEHAMQATISVVELLGATIQLTTLVEGQRVRVTVDSDNTYRTGDTLWLQPNPERIRWYDPKSGHALNSQEQQA